MNGEMAKRHWKWAANALNAANRDALNHDPQNAVSRAYYAMMHAANAGLAVKGLQPKTHSGTQMLFNEHLAGASPGITGLVVSITALSFGPTNPSRCCAGHLALNRFRAGPSR